MVRPDLKHVADFVTASRVLIAVAVAWLGATRGAEALPLVTALTILNWSGDATDGVIAGRSRNKRVTWIGRNDLLVDITFSIGLLFYLASASYLPWQLVGGFLIIWTIVVLRYGYGLLLGQLLQAPIYGWLIWITFSRSMEQFWWITGWIVLATVLSWPKVPKVMVGGFLSSIMNLSAAGEELPVDES